MKIRNWVLILLYSSSLIFGRSTFAQDPPPAPPIVPEKEADHTAANEKMAKEIQKAIDALHPLKDVDKIEMLKKIKKHIEDNKKTEPSKNIDDAVKKVVKKGEGTPQWLENLIKEWKKTLGIAKNNPDEGWKTQGQTTPIQPIQQSWSYRPIYFTEGTRQINTSNALITYTFPPHAFDVLLNVRIVSADGRKNWLLQNVPVPASTERMSYRIRTDMQSFIQNDKWPEEIRLEYNIGSIQYTPGFPTQGQVTLRAQPEVEDIGGSSIGIHPLFPVMYQPPSFTIPLDADTRQRIIRSMQVLDALLRDSLNVSLPPFNTYTVDSLLRTSRPLDIVMLSGIVQGALPFNVSMDFLLVTLFPIDFIIRGDAVPNIDLDSSKDPTDLNACVPAATANSLTWLDEQHEEIDLPGNTRETLDELKKLMKTLKEKGTEWDSMVKGKLDFIKKNNLPINVKYQAHAGAPAELKSNDPNNTQTAKNKSEPNPDKPGKYYHPDFDWLMQELKDGEDVELIWGNYCDTVVKDTTWAEIEVPMGGKIKIIKEIKDRAKKTRRGGHAVNVTGAVSVGPFKWITYKHDAQQGKPGGTEGFDNNGDATDVSQWVTDERGYTNFTNRNYKDPKDDVNCTVYVDAVISESYVPPPTEEKDTPKDDDPEDSSEDDSPEEEFSDPWDNITLTGTEAKIITVAAIPVKTSSAFVPILTGVVTTGALVYIITQESDDPVDCSFTAATTITAPSCALPNGAIQVVLNPADQYDFIWSNGSTAQNLTELPAGDYSATITKTGTTCTQIVMASLINLNPEVEASIQTTPADCGIANGSASVTPTFPGNYTYTWSNGSTEQNQSGLAAGNYTVTVNAGGTCEETFQIVIGENPFEPVITFTTTPSSCGQSDGTIQVSVDPSAAYDYNWSGGQSGAQIANVGAGIHTVTVSIPGTSCSKTGEITVDELPAPFTLTTTTTPSSCGLSDGTATVISDPPGLYTIVWSNGQTTEQATALTPGNYSVTVTLQGTTCSQSTSITVDELPPAFTLTTTTTPAACGASDGTATVIADPPGTYSYVWSSGHTTEQAIALATGTYNVTVSIPGTNCTKSISVTVDQLPASFTLTTSTTPAGCGASDGSATVIPDPPGSYTYVWSNGQTTDQVVGLGPGAYTVTVTIMGSTCSLTTEVTVDQLPPPFTLSSSSTPANCGQNDGTATVIPDPPAEYTFIWTDGQTTPTANGLMLGIHEVTVTIPGTTCSQTIQVEVGQVPLEASATTSSTPAGCGIANGTATVDTVISPPGFVISIEWSNGQIGPQATGLIPGTYIVTITLQASECLLSITDTVTVDQVVPNFTGNITSIPADCGLSNGSATITIVPEGPYTIEWSNQQMGPVLQNVNAGTYSVVVTDANSCTASFSSDIPQLPAEHITITNTTPGDCTGGGEISFTLVTNGAGPLVVEVITPEGTISFTVSPGNYLLSAFTNVVPGSYTLNVYDQGAGPSCIESTMTTVQDLTPVLSAEDDFYFTESEVPVDGNMLDNDTGLDLQVIGVSNIFGGTVTFNALGDFTFIPDPGFAGDGMFTYTVTDVCGDASTAVVTITVELVECNFTILTTIIPANCGVSNGYINIEVNEPGSYTYFWSTGDSGSELEDVAAGEYTVTIADVNLGCELEFTMEVTEFPAEYVDDIVITQPTCSSPGEIQFTLSVPGPQNMLTMSVDHPNGIDVFFVDPGVTRLSDFVDITPGTYTIEVFIGNAGPECVESFTVTLVTPPSLTIFLEAVFPPSAPPAMDGMAIVIIQPPFGEAPWSILLDGLPFGTSPDPIIEIMGLGVGTYSVQIVDNTGCESNIIMVTIPFPDEPVSFGAILFNLPYDASNVEHQPSGTSTIWSTGVYVDIGYQIGSVPQRIRAVYVPALYGKRNVVPLYGELTHLTKLASATYKKFKFGLEGGFGIRDGLPASMALDGAYTTLQASSKMEFGKILHVQAELNLRGWRTVEEPQWGVTMTLPFIK